MAIDNPSQGRTIEDIERRQQDVHALELDAVRTLVHVLRELAIALPPESKFPYDLADTAKSLERTLSLYGKRRESPQDAAGTTLF